MAKAWTRLSLDGEGLQSTNLALARVRKNRVTAYGLWLIFPVGAHAFYLRKPLRAVLYGATSASVLLAWTLHAPRVALGLASVEMLLALYDLYWIDRRVTALNKLIRMQVSLRPGAASKSPEGYRGRYPDDDLDAWVRIKEQERAGHQVLPAQAAARNLRAPSFAEQEAQLRAQSQTRKP